MSNRKAFDYTLRISSFSTVTGFTKDDYTGIVEIQGHQTQDANIYYQKEVQWTDTNIVLDARVIQDYELYNYANIDINFYLKHKISKEVTSNDYLPLSFNLTSWLLKCAKAMTESATPTPNAQFQISDTARFHPGSVVIFALTMSFAPFPKPYPVPFEDSLSRQDFKYNIYFTLTESDCTVFPNGSYFDIQFQADAFVTWKQLDAGSIWPYTYKHAKYLNLYNLSYQKASDLVVNIQYRRNDGKGSTSPENYLPTRTDLSPYVQNLVDIAYEFEIKSVQGEYRFEGFKSGVVASFATWLIVVEATPYAPVYEGQGGEMVHNEEMIQEDLQAAELDIVKQYPEQILDLLRYIDSKVSISGVSATTQLNITTEAVTNQTMNILQKPPEERTPEEIGYLESIWNLITYVPRKVQSLAQFIALYFRPSRPAIDYKPQNVTIEVNGTLLNVTNSFGPNFDGKQLPQYITFEDQTQMVIRMGIERTIEGLIWAGTYALIAQSMPLLAAIPVSQLAHHYIAQPFSDFLIQDILGQIGYFRRPDVFNRMLDDMFNPAIVGNPDDILPIDQQWMMDRIGVFENNLAQYPNFRENLFREFGQNREEAKQAMYEYLVRGSREQAEDFFEAIQNHAYERQIEQFMNGEHGQRLLDFQQQRAVANLPDPNSFFYKLRTSFRNLKGKAEAIPYVGKVLKVAGDHPSKTIMAASFLYGAYQVFSRAQEHNERVRSFNEQINAQLSEQQAADVLKAYQTITGDTTSPGINLDDLSTAQFAEFVKSYKAIVPREQIQAQMKRLQQNIENVTNEQFFHMLNRYGQSKPRQTSQSNLIHFPRNLTQSQLSEEALTVGLLVTKYAQAQTADDKHFKKNIDDAVYRKVNKGVIYSLDRNYEVAYQFRQARRRTEEIEKKKMILAMSKDIIKKRNAKLLSKSCIYDTQSRQFISDQALAAEKYEEPPMRRRRFV